MASHRIDRFCHRFSPDPQLSLKVRANLTQLPEKSRTLFKGFCQPSELWSLIPQDALLAMAFRTHPKELLEFIETFLDEKDRQKFKEEITAKLMPFLGTEDLSPIVKGIGPDHGFWVVKPAEKNSLPYVVLATRLGDGEPGKEAQKMLEEAAEFAFRLASTSQKGIKLERDKLTDGTPIRILTIPDAPKGFRPAFTSKHQYFFIGSHPHILTNLPKPKPITNDEIPIMRLSAPSLKSYLIDNGPWIAQLAEDNKKGKAAEILKEFQTLIQGIEDLDKLELSIKPTENTLSINFRLYSKPK